MLVLGIGFFLKYAVENAWIGPTGRVALGVLAGLAMLGAGDAARRRDYRFLSQGLTGGGVAALYLSIFAAANFYQLIPREASFLLMIGRHFRLAPIRQRLNVVRSSELRRSHSRRRRGFSDISQALPV